MIFSEGVEYREAATKTQGAQDRESRRHSTRNSIRPRARCRKRSFTGNFDFTDGPMRALSNDATYILTAGTLALTGKEITPEISDESLTLLAEAIDVTLDPRKMIAKGNVRSTLLPPKKPAGKARGDQAAGAARRQGARQHPEHDADLRRSQQEGGVQPGQTRLLPGADRRSTRTS